MEVLIVDDNDIVRAILKEILRSNYPSVFVSEAADGQACIERFENRHRPPDLVLMDIKLPDSNGLKLTEKIRSLAPTIPVVIVTNNDTPEYREAAHQYGARAFLSKGSSLEREIVSVITALFPEIDQP